MGCGPPGLAAGEPPTQAVRLDGRRGSTHLGRMPRANEGNRDEAGCETPEAKSGRWGQGLTKAKMAECQWLKPELVGQFEFLEWTGDNHLRHSKFVGLREDKKARDVVRE